MIIQATKTETTCVESFCYNCGKTSDRFLTAYGEYLCEQCWDDYLFTDAGKVEYIIGICRGDYPMDYFDADFLCHCAAMWHKYRAKLSISTVDIITIQFKAQLIGLL